MMDGRKPFQFCRAVERVVGLAAVRVEWERELGDDRAWALSLLRATDQLAAYYPKPPPAAGAEQLSAMPYQIVWQDKSADRYVGSCPDGTSPIELCRADLVVYELDRVALAGRVAAAMGFTPDYEEVHDVPRAARIGVREPLSDQEAWVYMALQISVQELSDTIDQLAVRHDKPFVLITPTRAAWRASKSRVRANGHLLALEDVFEVQEDGTWILSDSAHQSDRRSTILDGANHRAPNRPAAEASGHLPDRNEMAVLRVLASATTLMVQEDISAATEELGRPLSRKTVGKVLQSLADLGLVKFPPGTRKGAEITDQGRAAMAARPGASH
jgi:hypothetical protein